MFLFKLGENAEIFLEFLVKILENHKKMTT